MFRKLFKEHDGQQEAVIAAYSAAEREGLVKRKSKVSGPTPEEYARHLWWDASKKGWHV